MNRYYTKDTRPLAPKAISATLATLKTMLTGSESENIDILGKALEVTGFAYDPEQDIYYSVMDAWQRNFGFCRLYNEAAAPLRMIVDSEQIEFEYDDKRWLIELWKGQYGITTGGEIGVFSIGLEDYNNSETKDQTLFKSANSDDILPMAFSLFKNQTILFTRKDKHWWLTGFVLGEFSEPSELSMNVLITLKDEKMRDAFVEALIKLGYLDYEFIVENNTVVLKFDKPHTTQPSTRKKSTDKNTQKKNKKNCKLYQKVAKKYIKSYEKFIGIPVLSPKMRVQIGNVDATEQAYELYDTIKKYMN